MCIYGCDSLLLITDKETTTTCIYIYIFLYISYLLSRVIYRKACFSFLFCHSDEIGDVL